MSRRINCHILCFGVRCIVLASKCFYTHLRACCSSCYYTIVPCVCIGVNCNNKVGCAYLLFINKQSIAIFTLGVSQGTCRYASCSNGLNVNKVNVTCFVCNNYANFCCALGISKLFVTCTARPVLDVTICCTCWSICRCFGHIVSKSRHNCILFVNLVAICIKIQIANNTMRVSNVTGSSTCCTYFGNVHKRVFSIFAVTNTRCEGHHHHKHQHECQQDTKRLFHNCRFLLGILAS